MNHANRILIFYCCSNFHMRYTVYDLFKYNSCIKTSHYFCYFTEHLPFFLITQIFYRTVLKKKSNILRPVVGFTVCNTVMDHLFVNNAVQLLVEHITQWGQYGRCTQSLGSANGCAGCMLGGGVHRNTVADRGALWRDWYRQRTPGNQSARHPPLCAIGDVESGAWTAA